MFRDCLRCGFGWRTETKGSSACPLCHGLNDAQAEYIRNLCDSQIELRSIARKAFYAAISKSEPELSIADLNKIGIYVTD